MCTRFRPKSCSTKALHLYSLSPPSILISQIRLDSELFSHTYVKSVICKSCDQIYSINSIKSQISLSTGKHSNPNRNANSLAVGPLSPPPSTMGSLSPWQMARAAGFLLFPRWLLWAHLSVDDLADLDNLWILLILWGLQLPFLKCTRRAPCATPSAESLSAPSQGGQQASPSGLVPWLSGLRPRFCFAIFFLISI